MSTPAIAQPRTYLASHREASLAADAVLVLGGTSVITASAFVTIPLPFTPVPLALSTFAVMATGAALGPLRGSLSAALYVVLGVLGAPVFSSGQSGFLFPTFGYVVGYVLAAAIVGQLAKHQADRRVGSTLALGALGTLALYACGVPWLMVSLGIDLGRALQFGVLPFLIGDTLKVLALAGLLPSLWRLVARVRPDDREDAR